MNYLRRHRPESSEIRSITDVVTNWIAAKKIVTSVYSLIVNSETDTDDQREALVERFVEPLKSVPAELEKQGVAKKEPPDEREGQSLVFYCGKTVEDWGPISAPEGQGGSERAVYEVSRRMAKRGFRVTVYCSCPKEERGLADSGVLWRHWAEFRKDTPRDTIVYWRLPEMLELPFPAEKRIVWCHDVQSADKWTKARVALVDHCMVLSKFHSSTLDGAVPESKIVVTQNGCDAELIRDALGRYEKDRNRIFYHSSPDRGMLTALRMFRRAREKNPKLTFHAYYGFSPLFFDWAAKSYAMHIPDLGYESDMTGYMRRVGEEFERTPGAFNHGRASWKDMARCFAESGIWLYPTRFPEISCICVMEAQAAGCAVVATDHAALKETIDWSSPMSFLIEADEIDQGAKCILEAAEIPPKAETRAALSAWAFRKYDWDRVCDSWVDMFKVEDPCLSIQ